MAESSYTNAEFLGLAGKADARFRGMPVAGAGQKISLSGSATANGVDLPIDGHVMLTATKECWIRFSSDGTTAAVADVDMYLVANTPYLLRTGAQADGTPNRRISALQAGSGGFLYIMPMVAE